MDVGESRMEIIKSKTHERVGLKNPAVCRPSQQHTHTVCILREYAFPDRYTATWSLREYCWNTVVSAYYCRVRA